MLKKPTELFRGLQTILRNEMVKEKVDMKRKKKAFKMHALCYSKIEKGPF